MTLAAEIEADIFSPDLEDDLFESVLWGANTVLALVEVSGVSEDLASGGLVYSDERVFKFRRLEIEGIETDLSAFGKVITYNGRTYDIDEVDERPGWPLIEVTATLRE